MSLWPWHKRAKIKSQKVFKPWHQPIIYHHCILTFHLPSLSHLLPYCPPCHLLGELTWLERSNSGRWYFIGKVWMGSPFYSRFPSTWTAVFKSLRHPRPLQKRESKLNHTSIATHGVFVGQRMVILSYNILFWGAKESFSLRIRKKKPWTLDGEI